MGFIDYKCLIGVHKTSMPDRDRLMMSPIEKWKKYRRFPFKLIIHAMLLAIVWIQILMIVSHFTSYYRANQKTFTHFFMDLEDSSETTTISRYSIDELMEWIDKSVKAYYTIDDHSMERFSIMMDPQTGLPKPVTMDVDFRPTPNIDNNRIETVTYLVTLDDPFGPFNKTKGELKKLLHTVNNIEFTFWFVSNMPTQFANAPFKWKVSVFFEREGSLFTHSMATDRYIQDYGLVLKIGWIPVLVIFFATISLVIGLKKIAASVMVYGRTKRKFQSLSRDRLKEIYEQLKIESKRVYSWDDMPLVVKMDFFSPWSVVELAGEVMLIVAAIIGLVNDQGMPISDVGRILTGLGCLIASTNMIRYLEYWNKFYTLVLTLQGAFTKNFRFVVSVAPLYMGYVACGHLVFGPYSDDFHTVDQTAVTLFALLNGDSIKDVFEDLHDQFPWPPFTRVYLYSFIVLFITAILNLFILMIEDAYISAKELISLKENRYSRRHQKKRDQAGFIIKEIAPEFDLPTLFDIIDYAEGKSPMQKKKRFQSSLEPKGVDDLLQQEISETQDTSESPLVTILRKHRKAYIEEMEKTMKKLQGKYLKKIKMEIEHAELEEELLQGEEGDRR